VSRFSRPDRRHDPERDAAGFLSGEQGRRRRERFERHLLACDQCWTEVWLARRGRALAELAREIAPAHLREDVRAAVALAGPGRRRRPAFLPASIAIVIAGAVAAAFLLTHHSSQPGAIAAALASYRADDVPAAAPASHHTPDLSDAGLIPTASGRSALDGLDADVFAYHGASGRRIFLFLSSQLFPQAAGATRRAGSVHAWQATDRGLTLVCADRPVSYLVVGADTSLVRAAEEALAGDPIVEAG
jgi:hypothetical protein